MKDENKTRVELLKKLEIIEQRITKLQKSNIQWKKSSQELKKDHLRLEQLARKHTTVLQESKDLLDKIINLNPDWVFVKDKNYHYILVNEGYTSALGKSKEELIGKNDIEVGFPEELVFGNPDKGIAGFRSDDQRVLEGEIIHNEYDPATAADGILHIFDTYKIPLRDSHGNIYAVLGYARDITSRKRAEEEIQSVTTKWQTTFNAMNDAVSLIDNNGIVLQCNQSYLNLFGKTETEVLGKHCWEIVHGADEAINKCPYAKMKKSFQRESILLPMDNRWFNVVVDPIFDADNNLVNAVHIITDITERKLAEENIKNAKDELQMILDSVPAIIFYKDIDGRIIRANKALADSLKMPIKDLAGKTTEELFPKEQAENMRKGDKEVLISGKAKRNIIQPYTTPDGIRWLTTDKIPYKDKEGKTIGIIGLSKDITLQRKSEQELQQSYQRLKKTMNAAIDTMSRIIEAKDPYTSGHQYRVCQLAVRIAQEMKLPKSKIEGIRIAALIHDIGKIGIPTEILSKPTRLTDIEFRLIKEHPQIGYNILESIDFFYPVARIVLQHHEKLNGSGYPNHLKGDKILPEAKIVGVADVVEAMSSHRPYRPALGIDKALEEIIQNRNIFYDPEVVDVCLGLFKEKGFEFE